MPKKIDFEKLLRMTAHAWMQAEGCMWSPSLEDVKLNPDADEDEKSLTQEECDYMAKLYKREERRVK